MNAYITSVAQWIARWISNPKVQSSNLNWGKFFNKIYIKLYKEGSLIGCLAPRFKQSY